MEKRTKRGKKAATNRGKRRQRGREKIENCKIKTEKRQVCETDEGKLQRAQVFTFFGKCIEP